MHFLLELCLQNRQQNPPPNYEILSIFGPLSLRGLLLSKLHINKELSFGR